MVYLRHDTGGAAIRRRWRSRSPTPLSPRRRLHRARRLPADHLAIRELSARQAGTLEVAKPISAAGPGSKSPEPSPTSRTPRDGPHLHRTTESDQHRPRAQQRTDDHGYRLHQTSLAADPLQHSPGSPTAAAAAGPAVSPTQPYQQPPAQPYPPQQQPLGSHRPATSSNHPPRPRHQLQGGLVRTQRLADQQGATTGQLRVNLNTGAKGGFFKRAAAVSTSAWPACGVHRRQQGHRAGARRSFQAPQQGQPIIYLDGDDRSGSALVANMYRLAATQGIRRI